MRHLRTLHRWLGFFVALFVIQVSVTGVLLNHTEDFGLDDNYVENQFVLDWYDLEPNLNNAYALENVWIIASDGIVFANTGAHTKRLRTGTLKAAVNCAEFYCVQIDNSVSIYTKTFAVVDQLKVPAGTTIGSHSEHLLAAEQRVTNKDEPFRQYVSNDLLNWQKVSTPIELINNTSQLGRLPKNVRKAIRKAVTEQTLPWERVIQDMHSGRILGTVGVWLVDIFALFLIVLAITGLWMWARVYRANR